MAVALAPSVPTNSLKYADLGRTNGYASVIQTLYYSAPSRPNEREHISYRLNTV